MQLKPSEIFFTQRRINNYFKKTTEHGSYMIGQTLDDLCTGKCTVNDIPTIQVMRQHGKWWAADNRRLWVFRRYEKLGGCTTIPVTQTYYIDERKKDSPNGGTSVVIRLNQPGGDWWRRPDGALNQTQDRSARSRYLDESTPRNLEDELSRLTLGSNSTRDQDYATGNDGLGYFSHLKSIFGLSTSDQSYDDTSDSSQTFPMSLPTIRPRRRLREAAPEAENAALSFDETEQNSVSSVARSDVGSTPWSEKALVGSSYQAVNNQSDSNNIVILDPEEVKFTKKRIGLRMEGRRSRGPSSVYDLWMKLVDGSVLPEYIPPIEVFHVYHKYWVVSGNKRLWAFRNAAKDLPGLLIQAVVHTDSSTFIQKVNENRKTFRSLTYILSIDDNVEVVDNIEMVEV